MTPGKPAPLVGIIGFGRFGPVLARMLTPAAVVGSGLCAELYNLVVLTEGIQDLKNNLTLFLGVKK